jgi:hypothetical protein
MARRAERIELPIPDGETTMIRKAAVVCALLMLPAALHAQQGQGGQGRGMGGGMMAMRENVPEFVAGKAADLALSAEQTGRIEAIARALTERNDAIMAEMRTAMQAGGMDRTRMMAARERITKNDEDAWKEVEAVLSAEQLVHANALIEEWRRTRPQPRRPGGGG